MTQNTVKATAFNKYNENSSHGIVIFSAVKGVCVCLCVSFAKALNNLKQLENQLDIALFFWCIDMWSHCEVKLCLWKCRCTDWIRSKNITATYNNSYTVWTHSGVVFAEEDSLQWKAIMQWNGFRNSVTLNTGWYKVWIHYQQWPQQLVTICAAVLFFSLNPN